ncbi:MAG: MFS transporter [Lachnospiraceae bacterium]|nr:MFS transporter [Candidatus Equihabitans merdae]
MGETDRRNARRIIVSISFMNFVSGAFIVLLGYLMPYMRDTYTLTYDFSGSLMSVEAIGRLAGSMFAVYVALWLSGKKAIILLPFLSYAGFIVFGVTGNKPILILTMLIIGLGLGSISSFANDVINRLPVDAAMYLTLTQAFFGLGAMAAPIIMNTVVDRLGLSWQWTLLSVVLMGTLSAIMFCFVKMKWYDQQISTKKLDRKLKADARKSLENGAKAVGNEYAFLKNKRFIIASVVSLLYGAYEASTWGWVSTYFMESGMTEAKWTAAIATILYGCFFLGRCICAFAVKFIPGEWMVVGLSAITFIFHVIAYNTHSLTAIMLGVIGVGFGLSGITTINRADIGDICMQYKAATGVNLTIMAIGAISVPMLIGLVVEHTTVHTGMQVLTVVAGLMLLFSTWYLIYNNKVRGKK